MLVHGSLGPVGVALGTGSGDGDAAAAGAFCARQT